MTIQHTAEVRGRLLHVKVSGQNSNLDENLDYGQSVLDAAATASCTYILCDESALDSSLSTFDIFESAKSMAENAPRGLKLAIVWHPQQLDNGQFWETVAVNRGFLARVFLDSEDAEEWLDVSDA